MTKKTKFYNIETSLLLLVLLTTLLLLLLLLSLLLLLLLLLSLLADGFVAGHGVLQVADEDADVDVPVIPNWCQS